MSRSKELRQSLEGVSSPLRKHSTNQDAAKLAHDGEGSFYRESNKVVRATQRRKRHETFMQNLPKETFNRCVERLRTGRATLENVSYVASHITDGSSQDNVGIIGLLREAKYIAYERS